ncbi:hypothetical protein BDF22DRAFT_674420, partial [Syncephalis plumigaleata]
MLSLYSHLTTMDLPFGDLDVEAFANESTKRERPELGPLPDYTPKQDTTGWLLSMVDDDTAFVSAIKERHGPNHVKSAIEYLYYTRQYDKVVVLAQRVLDVFDAQLVAQEMRVTSSSMREMAEITCRAAIRINDKDTVRNCIKRLSMSASNEPGVMLALGRANQFIGQYADAITAYLRFIGMRSQDYTSWRHIGECLDSLAMSTLIEEQAMALRKLSLTCYLHAMGIMQKSVWPAIDYIQTRYKRELDQLDGAIAKLQEAQHHYGVDRFARLDNKCIQCDLLHPDMIASIQEELERGKLAHDAVTEEESSLRTL